MTNKLEQDSELEKYIFCGERHFMNMGRFCQPGELCNGCKKKLDDLVALIKQRENLANAKAYKIGFKDGQGELWSEAMYYLAESRRKTLPYSFIRKYEPVMKMVIEKEHDDAN